MKTTMSTFAISPFISTTLLAAAFMTLFSLSLAAQQPP